MSKRRKQILFIACAAITLVSWWSLVHQREPEYKGLILSEWLRHVSPPSEEETNVVFQPSEAEVREAILVMSSNNLPLLVRWISYDSGKSIFIPMFNVMPVWFNTLSIFDFTSRNEERGNALAYNSAESFKFIGTAGAPAIPQLAEIVRKGSLVPGCNALKALGYIGEPALPAIISAAGLTNCPSRYVAIRSFWAHTNNPAVYNFLTNALNDADSSVRQDAADALKEIELY
jgi:hypothetical protein